MAPIMPLSTVGTNIILYSQRQGHTAYGIRHMAYGKWQMANGKWQIAKDKDRTPTTTRRGPANGVVIQSSRTCSCMYTCSIHNDIPEIMFLDGGCDQRPT